MIEKCAQLQGVGVGAAPRPPAYNNSIPSYNWISKDTVYKDIFVILFLPISPVNNTGESKTGQI